MEIKLEKEVIYEVNLKLNGESIAMLMEVLSRMPYNKVNEAILSVNEQLIKQQENVIRK